jgi:hypothetical protein
MWCDLTNNQMLPPGKKRTKDLPHNHQKIIPPTDAAAFTASAFPRRRQLTPSHPHVALDLRYHPPPPVTPLPIVPLFSTSHGHVHPLPPPPYMNTTEDVAAAPPLPAVMAAMAAAAATAAAPLPAAAAAMAAAPRQTAAVKEIMSKVISLQSTTKYAGQNATFAIFCYHSIELRDDLLEPWFIEEVSLQATEFVKQRHAKKLLRENESTG